MHWFSRNQKPAKASSPEEKGESQHFHVVKMLMCLAKRFLSTSLLAMRMCSSVNGNFETLNINTSIVEFVELAGLLTSYPHPLQWLSRMKNLSFRLNWKNVFDSDSTTQHYWPVPPTQYIKVSIMSQKIVENREQLSLRLAVETSCSLSETWQELKVKMLF